MTASRISVSRTRVSVTACIPAYISTNMGRIGMRPTKHTRHDAGNNRKYKPHPEANRKRSIHAQHLKCKNWHYHNLPLPTMLTNFLHVSTI